MSINIPYRVDISVNQIQYFYQNQFINLLPRRERPSVKSPSTTLLWKSQPFHKGRTSQPGIHGSHRAELGPLLPLFPRAYRIILYPQITGMNIQTSVPFCMVFPLYPSQLSSLDKQLIIFLCSHMIWYI